MSDKKPEAVRVSSIPPFGLRMLPELRERIASAAQENGRSLNGEIVSRLEASFKPVAFSIGTKGPVGERFLKALVDFQAAVQEALEHDGQTFEGDEARDLKERLEREQKAGSDG